MNECKDSLVLHSPDDGVLDEQGGVHGEGDRVGEGAAAGAGQGAGAHAVGLAEAEVGGEEEARGRGVEGDVGVEGLGPVADVLHVDLVPLQHAVTVLQRGNIV